MQSPLVRICVLLGVLSQGSFAQTATTRVSLDTAGIAGDSHSFGPALSRDGRIAVFVSDGTNLVAGGDFNQVADVFIRDRLLSTTTRVSVSTAGAEANDRAYLPVSSLSADGRYVAFLSDANNLVAGDTNLARDVFLHDRIGATTTRANLGAAGVQANSDSVGAALSADGRFLAFSSTATNLVPADTNGFDDVFVRDLQTGVTSRVSLGVGGAQANSDCYVVGISSDGRFVVLTTDASNLVGGDTNDLPDAFVRDRQLAQTTRVSVGPQGLEGNGFSFATAISADGHLVAFHSVASNLVANDVNGVADAFVHDRATGLTALLSLDAAGNQANSASLARSFSEDGRYVSLWSSASNLVAGDTNLVGDVFVRDLQTGVNTRVSVGALGEQGNAAAGDGVLSGDGRIVGFSSVASNLVAGDVNGAWDAFVRNFPGACASTSYCTAGTTTNGCSAAIHATGTPSASGATSFVIHVDGVDGQRSAMLFYGVSGPAAAPWASGSSSFLCVKTPTQRTGLQMSGGTSGQCDGQLVLDWNVFIAAHASALGTPFVAGDSVHAQSWFRDPPAPRSSQLSNALEFSMCP